MYEQPSFGFMLYNKMADMAVYSVIVGTYDRDLIGCHSDNTCLPLLRSEFESQPDLMWESW